MNKKIKILLITTFIIVLSLVTIKILLNTKIQILDKSNLNIKITSMAQNTIPPIDIYIGDYKNSNLIMSISDIKQSDVIAFNSNQFKFVSNNDVSIYGEYTHNNQRKEFFIYYGTYRNTSVDIDITIENIDSEGNITYRYKTNDGFFKLKNIGYSEDI